MDDLDQARTNNKQIISVVFSNVKFTEVKAKSLDIAPAVAASVKLYQMRLKKSMTRRPSISSRSY